MILVGRYLSPFVRRVAITLHLYDLAYEHRPLTVGGDDRQKVRELNPDFSLKAFQATMHYDKADDLEHLRAGLEKAGLGGD